MNSKLIALFGHAILFAGTMYAAMSLVSIGLIDLFFWTAIIIGLWSSLGTPKAWAFSTGVGCFQIIVQAVVIIAIIVRNARPDAPERGRSEGAEFFIILDMVKSGVVFLITVGIVRGVIGLVRRQDDTSP